MKPHRLYIIMCILSLLSFAGCRDEEAVQSAESKRTITVNLGIAMSRVVLDDTDLGDDSQPTDMKVWIFNQDNTVKVDYYEISNPIFSGSDALGELVNTYERIIELENEVTALNFYVVLNSGNAQGLSPFLDENSMPDQIKAAFFTGLQNVTADNEVPAYGCEENFDVSDHKNSYSVPTINVTRSVGKLELFFTRESENTPLTINSVSITHEPNIGYLKEPEEGEMIGDANHPIEYSERTSEIFSTSTAITTVLTAEEEETTGNFSAYEDDVTKMQHLFSTYLLENPNGGTWTETGDPDYVYPPKDDAEDDRYKLTVSYNVDNKDKKQIIYLPAIERNVWNKIFVRVKGGTLQIQYKVFPWYLVGSEVGYIPEPMYTNPFSGNEDKTNQYILLPLEKYGTYKNTNDLFNHLYENPELGDNEARLCILTRPTYNLDEHTDLKAGSAGAQYYFMLTGPKGATWEAHLTNTDDFAFSTSDDNAFALNEDEFGNENVRMVTHGIARDKPYIIQINAKHLYTGYKEGMSGYTSEKGFDNNGYNSITSDWEKYFGDDYLTDWGRARWEAEEVVDTYFYITVKLKDGQDYVLTINPSYEDDRYTIEADNEYFPFKEKRRFAGTDTHIWIRHLRAQYNWRNLEYLARDLKEDIKDDNGIVQDYNRAYWWTVNPYWNPEHDENVWK